jgi:hypothetical protein
MFKAYKSTFWCHLKFTLFCIQWHECNDWKKLVHMNPKNCELGLDESAYKLYVVYICYTYCITSAHILNSIERSNSDDAIRNICA